MVVRFLWSVGRDSRRRDISLPKALRLFFAEGRNFLIRDWRLNSLCLTAQRISLIAFRIRQKGKSAIRHLSSIGVRPEFSEIKATIEAVAIVTLTDCLRDIESSHCKSMS